VNVNVLTPPMIAKRWQCKAGTVIRLLKTGQLRGFVVSPPGSKRPRWRVTTAALEAYERGDSNALPARGKAKRRAVRVSVPAGPF
jgi:hypothetical protein